MICEGDAPLLSAPRIDGVGQTVANQIEGQRGHYDGHAGVNRQKGIRANAVHRLGKHIAPFGRGGLDAHA